MGVVVIDHKLDMTAGVYRMVVGESQWIETEDEDGHKGLEFVGYMNVQEIVFATNDSKWQGKTWGQIKKEQQDTVQGVMAKGRGKSKFKFEDNPGPGPV